MELIHEDLSKKLIEIYYRVYNELSYGFLERVYKNAMCYELRAEGLPFTVEKQVVVHYKGAIVGDYRTDIVVDNKIMLELKAAESLVHAHEIQLLNYLRCTEVEIGFLMNFGKTPQFSRKIYTNDRKSHLKKG